VAVTKINEFMAKIGKKGGMSLTTGFDVIFEFNGIKSFAQEFYTGENKDVVHMLCDEGQLPNVQSATGQLTGRYLGESTVQYPHSRLFTDLSLGFLCDAELIPLKFFTSWYDFIFSEGWVNYKGDMKTAKSILPGQTNRPRRLQYMDSYVSTLKIIKTEPNASSANGRAPITFMLENCYPYAIDAVPLSYGTSQITRVNVNFYYSRHTVGYGETVSQSMQDLAIKTLEERSKNVLDPEKMPI